jgi:protein-disulfide isomerase
MSPFIKIISLMSERDHRAWNILRRIVAVVGLLAIGGQAACSAPIPAQPPENTAVVTPTDAAPMEASPSLGPQNAPITIIIYSDFGCPACWT